MSADDERQPSRRDWLAVGAAVLGAFMAVLDIQITNASLKDITGALGATLDEGSWVSLGYLLPEIIIIPLTGWLAQVFGLRRYLLANIVLFSLFSALCGMAWNLPSLVAFRFGQGLTGGALIPLAFTLVLTLLPASKQPLGFAIFGMSVTFAPAIGPTIGGWMTGHFGWEWNFYLNLLPAVLMYAGIHRGLPDTAPQYHKVRQADWAGMVAMAVGLGSFTFFLEEGNRRDWLGSGLIQVTGLLALVCLPAFVVIELFVAREPFVNLRLFRRRNFAVGSVISAVLGAGLYGSIFLLPLYLAQMQGYSALQIGGALLWLGLPQLVAMPLASRMTQTFDPRLVTAVGLVAFAGSCLLTARFNPDFAGPQLHAALILRAIGFPFIIVPLTSLSTQGIPPALAGSASGLFNMVRNLGGSIGIAALGTWLTRREHFHSAHLTEFITPGNLLVGERLTALSARFVAAGHDAVTAGNMALRALDQTVRQQAFFLAYNDCFLVMGLALLVCLPFLPLSRRPAHGASTAALH